MHLSIGPLTGVAPSASGGAGAAVAVPVAIGALTSSPETFSHYAPILEFSLVEIQVAAVTSGGVSPTLDAVLQGSFDGTIWFSIVALTQFTATGDGRAWIHRDVPTTGVPFGYINRVLLTPSSSSGVATWTTTIYLNYIGFGAGA